jgi:trehalose 6-phosphate phosphatase
MLEKQNDIYIATAGWLETNRLGLVCDIDGTLSPIAPTPADAVISARCRRALMELAQSGRFTVVGVLSGRAALPAHQMVGLDNILYIGNHGLEILLPGEKEPQVVIKAARPYQNLITSVLETLEYKLWHTTLPVEELELAEAGFKEGWQEGLVFENKGVTASIHYRLCPAPLLARRLILKAANEIALKTGLRVSEGRMVIELRPPVEVNKGTSLANLIETYHLNGLLFLGDDITDVDGFRTLQRLERESMVKVRRLQAYLPVPFKGLAVGVKSSEMAQTVLETADFVLEGVSGVEHYLEWLCETLNRSTRVQAS